MHRSWSHAAPSSRPERIISFIGAPGGGENMVNILPVLFTILGEGYLKSPSAVRAHLHLLSRLSFALHDSGFKSVIMRQAPREEIMGAARQVEASLPGCVATQREGQ